MDLSKAVRATYYTIKFGGFKLFFVYIKDKLLHENKKRETVYKIIEAIPEKDYERRLTDYYGLRTLRKIDIKKPVTFNEKIQWLKLYDPMNGLKTELADKYAVRKWIENKIGEEYLIPLLGVWDTIADIDINGLPDKFVLKTNHGCGTTMIITDKNNAKWSEIEKQYEKWLATNYAFLSFEPHYKDITPKIIAEEYIEQSDGNLYDYKIHCFNGKPQYIHVIGNRELEKHAGREAFYDIEWNMQAFTSNSYPAYEHVVERPTRLKEMLQIAEILSADLSYVRVDLYELDNGEIKFGEMTFTPGSGMYWWNPPEMDEQWGKILKLPMN